MVKVKARRKKRQFTQAFKLEAVRLAQTSGQSVAKVERDLDLSVGLLGRWVREFETEGQEAFLQQRSAGHQARIRELERRLALAEEERDILKKAVAIFSRPKDNGSNS
jgi:transposase